MKQTDQAIAQLKAAIAAEPNGLEAYAVLGQIYLAQGRLDDALPRVRRARVEAAAGRDRATMAAILVEMQGRLADATARYEQIVKLDPRAAVASNNLAWRYAETGKDLGAALRPGPGGLRADAATARGAATHSASIYLRQGQPALALAPLREAVEHAPDNPVYPPVWARPWPTPGRPRPPAGSWSRRSRPATSSPAPPRPRRSWPGSPADAAGGDRSHGGAVKSQPDQ